MDAFWDSLQFGLHWLLAGMGALLLAGCWRWIKRAASATGHFFAQLAVWAVGINVLLKVFRTAGETLRTARTPEQRAYAILGIYSILLKHAADIATAPSTPRKLVESIKDIDKTLHPVISEYVDAVRFKYGQTPVPG
jgi:hypothetical protein